MKIVKVKWVSTNINDEVDDEVIDVDDITEFVIDDDVPLIWLMISFCNETDALFSETYFEYKKCCLRGTDTPGSVRMFSGDVIYAYIAQYSTGLPLLNRRVDNGLLCKHLHQASICIRMHREEDVLHRVIRTEPLLPQLMQGLSEVGPHENGSVSFVHDGVLLSENDTAEELNLVNGDVVDAFNFELQSSYLSVFEPSQDLLEAQDTQESPHARPRLINFMVVCEARQVCYFKLERSTLLSRMMDMYCERETLYAGAAFIYKWRRLRSSKTLEEEKVEEGGVIHAVPHSTG